MPIKVGDPSIDSRDTLAWGTPVLRVEELERSQHGSTWVGFCPVVAENGPIQLIKSE